MRRKLYKAANKMFIWPSEQPEQYRIIIPDIHLSQRDPFILVCSPNNSRTDPPNRAQSPTTDDSSRLLYWLWWLKRLLRDTMSSRSGRSRSVDIRLSQSSGLTSCPRFHRMSLRERPNTQSYIKRPLRKTNR